MDVLVRAVNSALFVSHGIRNDTEIILHLLGGPGPDRRILFNGETLSGVRPDERSIAGQIKAILKQPAPPIGIFKEITQGIFDTGGGLIETISEWTKEGVSINVLDANGGDLSTTKEPHAMGFILSDHISNIFNLILCFDTQVCAGISESNSDCPFKGFITLKNTCFLFPITCNNPVIKQLIIAVFDKDIVFKPNRIFLICRNLRC